MGISVGIRLLVERVPERTWERVYADSLTLLQSWPDPPLGLGYREVAGIRVVAYTRAFVGADGWCVVRDANSRRGAESFELPRTLRSRGAPIRTREAASKEADEMMDVLQALALENENDCKPSRLSCLLGSKTQGEPYHTLIVAVATLIENRLPGVALAYGDFDMEDADRACAELNRIFDEEFARPVLLEPMRIKDRVPSVDAESLSVRHVLQVEPEAAVLLERLRGARRSGIRGDLEATAVVCKNMNQLCEEARTAFRALGIRLAGLAEQLPPLPLGKDRRHKILRAIANGTCRQYQKLTDMAWDCIESADDETLEFLYRLSQLKCDQLEAHEAFRAIYENPVVREYVMTSGATAAYAPPRPSICRDSSS